jgi:hypothetical protein
MVFNNMHTHYHRQNEFLEQLQQEAEQGGDRKFYDNLLQQIESNSRDWIFHQMQSRLTLEQHESLIKRKHCLIDYIMQELADRER